MTDYIEGEGGFVITDDDAFLRGADQSHCGLFTPLVTLNSTL